MTTKSIPTWGDHAASDPRSVAAQLRGTGDGRGERFLRMQDVWLMKLGRHRTLSADDAFKRAEAARAAIDSLLFEGLLGRFKYVVVKIALLVGFVSVYDS